MKLIETLRLSTFVPSHRSLSPSGGPSYPWRVSGALVVGLIVWNSCETKGQESRPSGPSERTSIHALARLEPKSGLLAVGARPGARIMKLMVEEGDDVKAGAELALLEGNEQAAEQVAIAELQQKDATSKRARAKRRLAIEREIKDKIFEARKQALERQDKLNIEKNSKLQVLHKGMATLGTLEKMPPKDQFEFEAALYLIESQTIKSGLDLSELKLSRTSLDAQRAIEDEEIAENGPQDQLLDRQLRLARAALEQTIVRAPAAGRVLSIISKTGESSTGGLLVLGDPSSIVAQSEVDQSDVGKLKVGDAASISFLGQTVAGKVSRIGRLVGFNRMRDIDPRAPQDLRVVRVTIELGQAETASHYLGMQVDATITPSTTEATKRETGSR